MAECFTNYQYNLLIDSFCVTTVYLEINKVCGHKMSWFSVLGYFHDTKMGGVKTNKIDHN